MIKGIRKSLVGLLIFYRFSENGNVIFLCKPGFSEFSPFNRFLYIWGKVMDMDLQTRKLKAIKYLIQLQDEKLFNKIESAIIKSQTIQEKKRLKPFSQRQLILRAKKSNQDYLAGNVKTQDQLEQESENW
jgi:hypothetical protein